MSSFKTRCVGVLLLGSFLALGACATVRPEERENLAKPSMGFGGEANVEAHEEHLYSNREGTMGASAVSGGGCGCN